MLTLRVRTAFNRKTAKNEICMISMLWHTRFHIDKAAPQPPFERQIFGLTRPATVPFPYDLNTKLSKYKSTRKFDSERELLSWFLAQYQKIDADLIVTHDHRDCQLDVIEERVISLNIAQPSRLGRLRISNMKAFGRKPLDSFLGRMVCDVKVSAEECLSSRSYDLQTLCENVLKLKENERIDVNDEDLAEMYESVDELMKLISLTTLDATYVLRIMYKLNIMPLALQITNICGNTMTRTLQHGRNERNEFLLLHAFHEKNYIVPDKKKREWHNGGRGGAGVHNNTTNNTTMHDNADGDGAHNATTAGAGRKKAAYSGGLVLEPLKGLYDKYILLLDFNSLYPSIIQEYNICFTTVQPAPGLDALPELPNAKLEPGILPQQLRRLVESRREVKKLLAAPDLSPELETQYNIRQKALKLTANSMYGCLGFAGSRFYAQHLAALVTFKGREILTNTKALVEKLNYQVVYGDTDSIMVNTNITDYDQVYKIGHSIKQSVNKLYKQLELDIDGVFNILLLLKKKKYAAMKVSKNSKGELQYEQELKGLDIVRRDWSQLSVMVGKSVLNQILSTKPLDEKLEIIHAQLDKIKNDLTAGNVPMSLFIITKQLSKAPAEFSSAAAQPHVQVALRMNATRNRRFKKGDMVEYVICLDGTNNPPTQRAYHLDELKSNETLKIDNQYYLAHQIHPVVTRMLEVLDGTEPSHIAELLGLDASKYRTTAKLLEDANDDEDNKTLIRSTLQKYRRCEKFKFICVTCKSENIIATAFRPAENKTYEPVLQKCVNPDCATPPYQYIFSIRNQLILSMRNFITRFYQNWLICDDPTCNQNTRILTPVNAGGRPVCWYCKNGSLICQYSEGDLYNQLCYFQYIFDIAKQQQKNISLLPEVEVAYNLLRETVDQQLEKSAYGVISLGKLFHRFNNVKIEMESQ